MTFREAAIALLRREEDERFIQFTGHAPLTEDARSVIMERDIVIVEKAMEVAYAATYKFYYPVIHPQAAWKDTVAERIVEEISGN